MSGRTKESRQTEDGVEFVDPDRAELIAAFRALQYAAKPIFGKHTRSLWAARMTAAGMFKTERSAQASIAKWNAGTRAPSEDALLQLYAMILKQLRACEALDKDDWFKKAGRWVQRRLG